MRITHLSTAVVEANFDWTFIKVATDEGITGYGEAFLGPGLTSVIDEFRTLLIGEEISSVEPIVRRLKASCVHASPGLTYHAILGIEAALLDAVGKKHQMPVWQLLGGKYRSHVPVYVDCHSSSGLHSLSPLAIPRTPHWAKQVRTGERQVAASRPKVHLKYHGEDISHREIPTPDAIARRAREMADRGFRALKFDLDVPTPYESDEYNRELSNQEIEYLQALVEAARRAVGREVDLAFDCHWNYNLSTAVRLASALEPFQLLWLEDPIPPDNIQAYKFLQAATRTPIATGENHYLFADFEALIRVGLRVLTPDTQKIGLLEGKKIATLADAHNVNLALHNIGGPLSTIAAVHLAAAIPNFLILEWHASEVPFFDELILNGTGPLIEEGKIRVPDKPGLGIELNLDVAYRYRKAGEPFFEEK